MATSQAVIERVEAIYRRRLEREYGDRLTFAPIRVIPDIDQWGDEYLRIEVVLEGDRSVLDPRWINALYGKIQPELLELGVTNIPMDLYIDKAGGLAPVQLRPQPFHLGAQSLVFGKGVVPLGLGVGHAG